MTDFCGGGNMFVAYLCTLVFQNTTEELLGGFFGVQRSRKVFGSRSIDLICKNLTKRATNYFDRVEKYQAIHVVTVSIMLFTLVFFSGFCPTISPCFKGWLLPLRSPIPTAPVIQHHMGLWLWSIQGPSDPEVFQCQSSEMSGGWFCWDDFLFFWLMKWNEIIPIYNCR